MSLKNQNSEIIETQEDENYLLKKSNDVVSKTKRYPSRI